MHTLTLTCLGTGDGIPGTRRNHSAYLYTFGDANVLIDCGEPVSQTYAAAGLSPDLIDTIVISHMHSDHFSGLFMLLQSFWLDGRRKPLPIYMPHDAISTVRQLLNNAYLFPDALPFPVTFNSLQPGLPVTTKDLVVTPHRTTHLDRARSKFQTTYGGEYLACCFLIEAGELRIGHSADIGAAQDLEPLLAQPLDLLLCEVAHVKSEVLFEYLKGRQIRRILFTHVARYEWQHLEEVREKAEQILKGMEYGFAVDGEKVEVKA